MELLDTFFSADQAAMPTNGIALVVGLLLAFLAGQTIAWIYMITHAGLSYSRAFVNSLVLMPVLVALVMFVLAYSLVTAFGLMAVFAIVRFRNILRDTLDTSYVLAVIVIGMACGTQKFATAVAGTIAIGALMLYLSYTRFGSRQRYDLILNLHWTRPATEIDELSQILHRHTIKAYSAVQRSSEGAAGMELSYRVLLRDPRLVNEMLSELRNVDGVSRLSSFKAEDESEL